MRHTEYRHMAFEKPLGRVLNELNVGGEKVLWVDMVVSHWAHCAICFHTQLELQHVRRQGPFSHYIYNDDS